MTGLRSSTCPFFLVRVGTGVAPSSFASSLLPLGSRLVVSSVTVNSGSLVARRLEMMLECSFCSCHTQGLLCYLSAFHWCSRTVPGYIYTLTLCHCTLILLWVFTCTMNRAKASAGGAILVLLECSLLTTGKLLLCNVWIPS